MVSYNEILKKEKMVSQKPILMKEKCSTLYKGTMSLARPFLVPSMVWVGSTSVHSVYFSQLIPNSALLF